MITINQRYCNNHANVASLLESWGYEVATIDEQDWRYEEDQTREFKQNLSAHDWETVGEWLAFQKALRSS